MLATDLENTGEYIWPIDRRVPDKIYVRMEVRDEAGNVASADAPEPLALDRIRPQGRLRDVRPAR